MMAIFTAVHCSPGPSASEGHQLYALPVRVRAVFTQPPQSDDTHLVSEWRLVYFARAIGSQTFHLPLHILHCASLKQHVPHW